MYADLIAGWSSGGVALLVGHPLDTIKSRLQTINAYRGLTHCFVETVRNESAFGLYKGMFAPFFAAGALNSLYFLGYGIGLKHIRQDNTTKEARWNSSIAEVQKESISRLNRGAHSYSGVFDCARQTIRNEGVPGLFKGGGVMFCRDFIGFTLYIPVYESLLRWFRTHGYEGSRAHMIAGGLSGVLVIPAICPFDVIKTRMQADKSDVKIKPAKFATEMLRSEGIKVFFKGGLALCLQAFIVDGILFVVYEEALEISTNLNL